MVVLDIKQMSSPVQDGENNYHDSLLAYLIGGTGHSVLFSAGFIPKNAQK